SIDVSLPLKKGGLSITVKSVKPKRSPRMKEGVNKNLASIRPSFIVKDLQASVTYYRERLGFQLDFEGPDDGPFWAGVSRDGIGIMLKAVASDVPPLPNHSRHEWAPPDAHVY